MRYDDASEQVARQRSHTALDIVGLCNRKRMKVLTANPVVQLSYYQFPGKTKLHPNFKVVKGERKKQNSHTWVKCSYGPVLWEDKQGENAKFL